MKEKTGVLIGKYLRSVRQLHKLSIDEVSKMSNVSASQISVIERGYNGHTKKYINITLTSLELIGGALNLTVEEILENSGYNALFEDMLLEKTTLINKRLRKAMYHASNQLSDEDKLAVIDFVNNHLPNKVD